MIKLTITEKGGEPRSLSFDKDEVSIGRVSGNDVVLAKGNISKRHSRLSLRDGSIELADLKSTNGTFLNGRKIADPMIIGSTDRIQIGDFMITLDSAEGDVAISPSRSISAARALPVPPPPPPPRSGSGLSGLPSMPGDGSPSEEDENTGYGMRSRSGRIPIPPPPPPPRRGTAPTAPLGLEDDGVDIGGADLAPPSPADVADMADGDELGGGNGPALFEGGRDDALDDASRPAAVEPEAEHGPESEPAAALASPEGQGEIGLTGPSHLAADAELPATDEPAPEAALAPELAPLDALLADPTVTQVVIAGPDSAFAERNGKLEPVVGGLGDADAIAESLWRLANTAVPPPAPDNPVVDVRLPDGTRIAAVFPPASITGVCGSIRKTILPGQSLADLGSSGSISKEALAVLEAAIASQRNLLITGDAGSVSALLAALAGAIPAGRRVVSIGAALPQPREGWTELAPVLDLSGLIRVAAALRADHLILGEVAGGEALDLLLAAAHGQEGMILGVTARSASEALARLEALAMQVPGTHGVAALANSTLDLVVHGAPPTDGGVRIVEISEVKLDGSNRLVVDPVLAWRSEGSRRSASGKMQILGVTSRLAASMASTGGTLPPNLIRK